jgi:hypothetical protein
MIRYFTLEKNKLSFPRMIVKKEKLNLKYKNPAI